MAIRNTHPDVWRGGGNLNPLREMNRLQRRVEHMFDNLLSDSFSNVVTPARSMFPLMNLEDMGFTPACDLDETETHYLVSFDLPGVKKENVKVELRDNLLSISGERKEEHKVEKASRLAEERVYGAFMRTFTLPSSVQADQVEASFENGVLRIAIPKAEGAKPKQIPIKEGKERKTIENKAA